jgi:hypothetical protein
MITTQRLIILIFIFLSFCLITGKQILLYKECSYMYMFIFLFIISMTALAVHYESSSSGCSIENCSDENVAKNISSKDLACQETNRVTWRRTIILSFIILLALNVVFENYERNIGMFCFIWFVLYFAFNFDQFHRFKVLCDKSLTKD